MGTRIVRRPAGRLLLIAGAALGLSACSANPTSPMSTVVSGMMMLDSGKGMGDHAVSSILGRDCAFFRVFSGGPICQDVHADAPVPEGMELIVTSRRPIYVAAREGAAAPAEEGTRPYLTDTMIFRAAPIRGTEATQTLVAAHAPDATPSGTVVAAAPQALPAAVPASAVSPTGPTPLQGSLTVGAVSVEALGPSEPAVTTEVRTAGPAVSVAALRSSSAPGLDAPLPPRRIDVAGPTVAALAPPVPPRRPDGSVGAPLHLASAVTLNLSDGTSTIPRAAPTPAMPGQVDPVRSVAVADLGTVPAPPRRPGWFLSPDAGAEVAAVPLLAPAAISVEGATVDPAVRQVADLPAR